MSRIILDLEPDLASQIEALSTAVSTLTQKVQIMAQNLSALQAAVAANTTVIGSAIVLIQGFSARLQEAIDNGADPVALQGMVDELNIQDAALAAAVGANTVAVATEPAAAMATEAPPLDAVPVSDVPAAGSEV